MAGVSLCALLCPPGPASGAAERVPDAEHALDAIRVTDADLNMRLSEKP